MKSGIKQDKITKSEQTRSKIEYRFLNMIPSKQWDKISVKELCEKCKITRGTFYLYFNDIYDLMEQIETRLLEDISERLSAIAPCEARGSVPCILEAGFDCTAPPALFAWFEFCRDHKTAIFALLDPKFGDPYFVKRLKVILEESLNVMMDQDGMPRDELRTHFLKLMLEMHFLSARTWLASPEGDFLSVDDIIHLLNAIRIGANYQHYKYDTEQIDPRQISRDAKT